MATTTQAEIESQVIELSTKAFNAFCEDMFLMFNVEMKSQQQEVAAETMEGLQKRFQKFVAINTIDTKGALEGTFQLIFDHGGLFTMSGVVVMMPERRIREEIQRGSIQDVEAMSDAVKEIGNLLVGSWDRIFREGLQGHGHFRQADTFIGTLADEKGHLTSDEEILFIPYEITVGSYPAFNCGVILPKTLFGSSSKDTDEPTAADNETANVDQEQVSQQT